MKKLSVILLSLLAMISAQAASPRFAGTYSDLTYNEEGGDILGTEIFIIPVGTDGQGDFRYKVLVQVDEGAPGPAAFVPVRVENNFVAFSVPASVNGGADDYEGTITSAGFRGFCLHKSTGKVIRTPIFLRRKKSYWD